MPADAPRRRSGTGFLRAMLPGAELGLVVAIFFIVLAADAPDAARSGQPVELSEPAPGARSIGAEAPTLTAAPAGAGVALSCDGAPLTTAQLAGRFAGVLEVQLAVDPGLSWQALAPVLQALAAAGVSPVLTSGPVPTGPGTGPKAMPAPR